MTTTQLGSAKAVDVALVRPVGARVDRRVMLTHLAASVLLQSTLTAVSFILPVVAKKQFGAGDFQTTLITAAPNIMAIFSIFWSAVFARLAVGRYIALYWVVGLLPLALVSFATAYWHVAVLAVISAVGNAGWTPVAGDLLKRLYPDVSRGAIYGVLIAAVQGFGALAAWGVGAWLHESADAFRLYMPLAAAAQGVGCIILYRLERSTRLEGHETVEGTMMSGARSISLRGLLAPVLHMRQILREDRVFARYEAAFMTYGVGWMTCAALVPLIVTEKLGLPYDRTMESTHMAFLLASLVCTIPAGRLIDRLGAPRTCMWAFGLYAIYPLGLLVSGGPLTLGASSLLYGMSAAAVNMGWMLGPVALAPTPAKVPQYIAIHTTLVGLRGAVFMFAGVGMYKVTGSFTLPLVVAALAFCWASWQMRSLSGLLRERAAAKVLG